MSSDGFVEVGFFTTHREAASAMPGICAGELADELLFCPRFYDVSKLLTMCLDNMAAEDGLSYFVKDVATLWKRASVVESVCGLYFPFSDGVDIIVGAKIMRDEIGCHNDCGSSLVRASFLFFVDSCLQCFTLSDVLIAHPLGRGVGKELFELGLMTIAVRSLIAN